MFPPIAEMIYLKAFSISVIVSLIKYFQECDKPSVATGPLKFELASLEHARKVFNNIHPRGGCLVGSLYVYCLLDWQLS